MAERSVSEFAGEPKNIYRVPRTSSVPAAEQRGFLKTLTDDRFRAGQGSQMEAPMSQEQFPATLQVSSRHF